MSQTPNLFQRVIKRFGNPVESRESPDPTPLAPPVGYKAAPSLAEQIREMVRSERLAREVAEAGYETFEESDDFEVDDDYVVNSPYENEFDPPISEMVKSGKEELDKKAKPPKAETTSSSPPQPKQDDPPKADQQKKPGEAGASDPK